MLLAWLVSASQLLAVEKLQMALNNQHYLVFLAISKKNWFSARKHTDGGLQRRNSAPDNVWVEAAK
jgi:hypothetical protein